MSFRNERCRASVLALAVSSALALVTAGAGAQVIDPHSAAVRDAYVGPVTAEKIQAALTGLNTTSGVTQTLFGSFSFGGSVSTIVFTGDGSIVVFNPIVVLTNIFAASDADLGAPGAPVDLTHKYLQALAGFTTARDFTVATSTIDTQTFHLTLNGVVTANGALTKQGSGILTLNGANVWNGNTIDLRAGTLQGNAASVATNVATGPATTVEFNQGVDGVYASQMSGGGSFVKNGAARLTVIASNPIGGEVRIEQGMLALSGAGAFGSSSALTVQGGTTLDISAASGDRTFGALSGSGNIVLGANTLATGGSASTAFSGSISGSGGLIKFGTGMLTLTSALAYTGGTTVSGGTLRLEGAGKLDAASPVSVASGVLDLSAVSGPQTLASLGGGTGGTVQIGANTLTVGGDNTSRTFSGSIQGSGGVTKTGSGTLTLDGVSAYTGTTTIASGTLNARPRSISDTTVDNGTLVFFRNKESSGTNFTESDTDVYSGTVSGSGKLIKEGDGVVWLRGANSYTGGTTIANGALIGNTTSLQGNIANNATLAFYQVTDGTYAGNLGGTGKLFVYGPGLVTMTGNAAADFTGVGGRLHVTGSLASNVSVAPGAEFGGQGTIAGNVVNGGRLTRGTTGIGPINVNGNVGFAPGSTLVVKTDASGASDRLALGGAASKAVINGGTVDVQAQAGNYAPQTLYNIVQAPGGVTGQFSAVTSNLAFLSPLLTYDSSNVFLTLTRNDVPFSAVAATPSQAGIAQAFSNLARFGTSEDAALVLNALVGLSAQQARAAFDSIAGAGRAVMAQTGVLNQRAINQNIVARLGAAEARNADAPATGVASRRPQVALADGSGSDTAPVYAQALPVPGSPVNLSSPDSGFWMRGYGGSGRVDGDASAAGAHFRFGGVVAGFDRALGNGVTLGLFGGHAEPRSDGDSGTGSAHTRSQQLGAYGRYRNRAWYLDGIGSYARQDTDVSRPVVVGPLARTATGSYDGNAWAAYIETGYALKGGITPVAGLSWLQQTQDAYTEQGAGALNLSVPRQRAESLRSVLGARAVREFQSGGAQWTLEGRAAWAHEFRDTAAVSARLAGDPTAAIFTVNGPSVPRDSAVLGAGLATEVMRALWLYADLSADLNSQQRSYALGAGLRYQW